jgi:S1-C subfamily serine protease
MSVDQEFEIGNKFSDSVIQLIVFVANYDLRRPFSEPVPGAAKGSSFIIDSKRGILLTNAHVVEDILSVKGLAPKTNNDIKMRLISICREKDLAIVQVFKEDWEILTKGKDASKMELQFEDTLHLEAMTRVVAVGYPLGQDNIKFTPGYIAGFETLHNDSSSRDDENCESVSYIQTTAPTNPGNSGGPLINIKTEKVVGVVSAGIDFAQNVGYAVSTRTLWSCLDEMMKPILHMTEPPLFASIGTSLIPPGGYKTDLNSITNNSSSKSPKSPKLKLKSKTKETSLPNIIDIPKMSFNYCRTSEDLMSLYLKDPIKGIYITKVNKDSAFSFLQEGSILESIIFQTAPYEIIVANIDNSSKVTCIQYNNDKDDNNLIQTYLKNKTKKTFYIKNVNRKFTIRELIDIIPINANCYCVYTLNGIIKNISFNFNINKEYTALQERFLHFQPLKYEIIAGLCLTNLCYNHISIINKDGEKFFKGDLKFNKHVIVTFTFSDTTVNELRSIVQGDIIRSINGRKIETLDDVKNSITNSNNNYIKIISESGGILMLKNDKIRQQDLSVIAAYQVKDYEYLL